jgi:Zn-dependent protease
VGTILMPVLFLLLPGNFLFGWAKPVPVSARNLRHPRRDMALVAAAGPLANLAMAFGWGLLLKLALMQGATEGLWLGLRMMANAGIVINLVLMALNLLPLPPLDGGRVLAGLVPPVWSARLDRIEPYGFMIIIVLLATGLLGPLIRPLMAAGQALLAFTLGFA